MRTKTIKNIAAISVMLCGFGHTLIHIIMAFSPSPNPSLLQQMEATKVKIIIERSIFDYHQGFSLAMGILLVGFGLQMFQNKTKNNIIVSLIITVLMTIISIFYFHPIAVGLMGLSVVFSSIHYFRL